MAGFQYQQRIQHPRHRRRKTSAAASVVLPLFLVAGGLAAVTVWRLDTRPPVEDYALIVDTSGSKVLDCANEVGGVARRFFAQSKRSGGTITLLSTGIPDHQYEPVRLLDRTIPPPGVFDTERKQQKLTDDLIAACESAAPTDRSALIQGVERAVAHLASRPCARTGSCHLAVVTDLAENYEDLSTRAWKIDNSHIARLDFCGYTGRKENLKVNMRDLIESWTAQFTSPETVLFQPYCGAAE